MFGSVSVCERIWRTPERSYHRPFAQSIGVRGRGLSRLLHRVLSDFGADESFARAANKVKEHYGFEIGASAVRRCTMESAQKAAELLGSEYAEDYRALPPNGKDCVIAQMDGSMICTVEAHRRGSKRPRLWREFRLTAAQAQGSVQSVYAATMGSVDEAGRRWGHCAKSAGRGLNSRIHCVADGAEWIALQSNRIFGQSGDFLCDFFHLSEYLGAAAPTSRPRNPGKWRKTQQNRLKRGATQLVVAELNHHLEASQTSDEDAPVRAAYRYLCNRLEHVDYPQAIARGLPIGSGLIESGHRHVLQQRLKLPGCAWRTQTAELMAQLRVLRANHRWLEIWN